MIVLEAEDQVGGIAKTAVRDGYRFDLGGHRFFTKAKEVDDLWHEIMEEEFLKRPRMSRIYWRDSRGEAKFLDYPLRGPDVMKKLGPIDLTKALLSYLWAAAKPKGKEDTFEQWVSNRFGRWLFNQFFKSYTEKVWGVPTSEIRAEWAAQRIKGLSFFSAAKSAFFGNRGNKIKSLISEFNYPRFGPGQMWETMTKDIEKLGGKVLLETRATKLEFEGEKCVRVHAGDQVFEPSAVISSLPLRNAVGMAEPHPRPEVLAAAKGLRYRDFLTVAVVLDGEDLFPDNWIYIHDPSVNVGRIQNFRSWSPWMVPDPTKACVGLEFFCFAGDELWETDDDKLVALGMRELEQLGLAKASPARVRLRGARAQGLPDVRPRLRRARPHDPLLARRARQLHPGRAQRPAPLQQLRPLLAHRDARGGQPREGHRARHLGGQRRVGLPRGGEAGRAAALHRGSRNGVHEGAAALLSR